MALNAAIEFAQPILFSWLFLIQKKTIKHSYFFFYIHTSISQTNMCSAES